MTVTPSRAGTCGEPLRDGPCQMDDDHRGRCSTVVHGCDACGKTRRGASPYSEQRDADGEVLVSFCWYCCKVDQ